MLKEEIVNVLLRSPKYKDQSKHFLMKNKKAVLQDMLDHINDKITEEVAIVDVAEVKPKIDKEVEREILDADLTLLKKTFADIAPKEMSRFDWDNYGDNGALKVFVKQWKGKLKSKGYDLSKLELKTSIY
jgi:hypothetical protein